MHVITHADTHTVHCYRTACLSKPVKRPVQSGKVLSRAPNHDTGLVGTPGRRRFSEGFPHHYTDRTTRTARSCPRTCQNIINRFNAVGIKTRLLLHRLTYVSGVSACVRGLKDCTHTTFRAYECVGVHLILRA